MAISESFQGSATIGATEYSLPNNAAYSTGSARTEDGAYQLFLDLNALVAGDEYELAVYEKVNSGATQRKIVAVQRIVGPPPEPILVLPTLMLIHGWDFTLKKISGTDRTITWSIRTPS